MKKCRTVEIKATNTQGKKIVARYDGKQLTKRYNYFLSRKGNHMGAARRILQKEGKKIDHEKGIEEGPKGLYFSVVSTW